MKPRWFPNVREFTTVACPNMPSTVSYSFHMQVFIDTLQCAHLSESQSLIPCGWSKSKLFALSPLKLLKFFADIANISDLGIYVWVLNPYIYISLIAQYMIGCTIKWKQLLWGWRATWSSHEFFLEEYSFQMECWEETNPNSALWNMKLLLHHYYILLAFIILLQCVLQSSGSALHKTSVLWDHLLLSSLSVFLAPKSSAILPKMRALLS